MNLREKVENNLTIWLLSALLAGFLAGVGTYESVLKIAQLEVIPKGQVDALRKQKDALDSKSTARVTTEADTNRLGRDYAVFFPLSLEGCKAECIRDERCRAYTYAKDPASEAFLCFLKEAATQRSVVPGAVSGIKEP